MCKDGRRYWRKIKCLFLLQLFCQIQVLPINFINLVFIFYNTHTYLSILLIRHFAFLYKTSFHLIFPGSGWEFSEGLVYNLSLLEIFLPLAKKKIFLNPTPNQNPPSWTSFLNLNLLLKKTGSVSLKRGFSETHVVYIFHLHEDYVTIPNRYIYFFLIRQRLAGSLLSCFLNRENIPLKKSISGPL